MRLRLIEVLALTTVAYLLSVIHKILNPTFYTDIGFVYDVFVLPTHNGIPYQAYSSSSPAVYVYPAIPSILTWVSGFAPNPQYYMATMAALTFPFVIAGVYFLYLICLEFGLDRGRIIPFFAMAPSFIIMSFYSWDIIAASLLTAATYYTLKKKQRLTGLCVGLGFAVKAYPLLVLPAFLKETQTWTDRLEMFLSAILGAIVPNLPFIIIDFPGWFNTVTYSFGGHGGYIYLEDSLWVLIRYYHLIDQDRLMTAVTWSLITLVILHVTFSSKPLLLKLWLIIAATILIFPTYPPQFNVWLLPLFVLNPILPLIPFLAFDFLDTAVILSWFAVDNPFQPWGAIWIIFLARIGILTMLLIWAARKPSSSIQRV